MREGGEIAGPMPRNDFDLRNLTRGGIEVTVRRKEARESGLDATVCVSRKLGEHEAWREIVAAGKSGQHGCAEEQERHG